MLLFSFFVCVSFQYVDPHQFYQAFDYNFIIDKFKNDVGYFAGNWRSLGRPVYIYSITKAVLGAVSLSTKLLSLKIMYPYLVFHVSVYWVEPLEMDPYVVFEYIYWTNIYTCVYIYTVQLLICDALAVEYLYI